MDRHRPTPRARQRHRLLRPACDPVQQAIRAPARAPARGQADAVVQLVPDQRERAAEQDRDQEAVPEHALRHGAVVGIHDLDDQEVLVQVQTAACLALGGDPGGLRRGVVVHDPGAPRRLRAAADIGGQHLRAAHHDVRLDRQAAGQLLVRQGAGDRGVGNEKVRPPGVQALERAVERLGDVDLERLRPGAGEREGRPPGHVPGAGRSHGRHPDAAHRTRPEARPVRATDEGREHVRPLRLVERERERLPGAPGGGDQPVAAQQRVARTVGQPPLRHAASQARIRDDLVAMGDQVLPGEDRQLLERRTLEARERPRVPGGSGERVGAQPPERVRLVPLQPLTAPVVVAAEPGAHPQEACGAGDGVHCSGSERRKSTTDR